MRRCHLRLRDRRYSIYACPMRALRVREVSVKEFHEVGSHALFLTTVERDTIPGGAKSLHLFHTFESYRRYLSVTKRSVHGGAVDAPAR